MSEPHSDNQSREAPRRFLHGRSLGPLLKPWTACLILAGLVFWFETEMPAFHEVVKIVYFVIGVVLVIFTGRALQTREGRRRRDERRHGDRRNRKRLD